MSTMKKDNPKASTGRGRPVMPAIPLPFEKRRAAKKAAVTAAAAAAAPAPSVIEEVASAPTTNALNEDEVKSHELAGAVKLDADAQHRMQPTHDDSTTADTSKTDSSQHDDQISSESMSEGPTTQLNGGSGSKMQAIESNTDPTPTTTTATTTTTTTKLVFKARSVSPDQRQMPPPFQPGGRSVIFIPNGDHSQPLPSGGYHQSQASTGSVQFGGMAAASNSASPAPPATNGFGHPPSLPFSHGGLGFAQQNGEGLPSHFVVEAANNSRGEFGLPAPPGRVSVGPAGPFSNPDPRGLRVFPDEAERYSRYPPNGPHNGHGHGHGHGHSESIHSHPSHASVSGPPGFPSGIPPSNGGPRPLLPSFEESSGLMQHIGHAFGNADFSDVMLDLRFANDRFPPAHIPSHRVLLARSSLFFHILQQQQPPYPQNITLETNDKWVRPDAFYTAVQSFYGLPLIPLPPGNLGENSLDGSRRSAGTVDERLSFALAYIASGHLLRWRPVVERGCEVAVSLLGLETVERTLEFAMERHEDRGSHVAFHYGQASEHLVLGIMKFAAKNVHFVSSIDPSAAKPRASSRLPVHNSGGTTGGKAAEQAQEEPVLPMEYGHSHGHGRRSQKMSGIQFGDLSVQSTDTETPGGVFHQVPSAFNAVMSRIMLNLPFPQLKSLVEMAQHDVHAKAEQVSHIVKQVLNEREKARHVAIQAVLKGEVSNSEAIKMCLRSPEPRSYDNWSVLGWREWETHGGFRIGRTWDPLQDERSSSVAEFP